VVPPPRSQLERTSGAFTKSPGPGRTGTMRIKEEIHG